MIDGQTDSDRNAFRDIRRRTSKTGSTRPGSEKISRLQVTKTWLEVIQSVTTIGGLFAAAVWFILQAGYASRINTSLSVQPRDLVGSSFKLVAVSIKVTNSGFMPVTLNFASATLERVVPVDDEVLRELKNGGVIRKDDANTLVAWPTTDKRKKDPKLTLYPGDTDVVDFEFVTSADIRTVRISAVVAKDGNRPGTTIWSQSTIYDIGSGKEIGNDQ